MHATVVRRQACARTVLVHQTPPTLKAVYIIRGSKGNEKSTNRE